MSVTRSLSDKQIQFEYTLHQQNMERVQSSKYLAITVTMTWTGVNIFLNFHVKQFGLGLGQRTLRRLHTKHYFALNSHMLCLFCIPITIYLMILSRSFSDHHLRCGGWLNLEFSKGEKHLGWFIKTIYKKQSRGMLKTYDIELFFHVIIVIKLIPLV